VQVIITVGLILSIAGGTSGSTSESGTLQVSGTSKGGIALYIIAFIAICLITIRTMLNLSHAETGEKRLVFGVIVEKIECARPTFLKGVSFIWTIFFKRLSLCHEYCTLSERLS